MKIKSSPKGVLMLCFIAYSLVYTGRLNLSIASPIMEVQGILGKEQIGVLGSIFFIVYAIGRMVNGSIGDRFPPKPFLAVGLITSAICNIAIASIPPVWMMYLLWGLNGFFQSMLWGAALRNVSMEYKDGPIAKRAAVILAVSVGVGSVLGIVAPTLLAKLGLAPIFMVPGITMLVMGIILLVLLPSHKTVSTSKKMLSFSCLKNKALQKMILPSIVHGAIKENLTLWVPLLFTEMYQLDLSDAAFYIFLMPVATLIGRLIFPIWFRICKGKEKLILITAFLVCAAALAPFLFFSPSIIVSAILLAVVSIVCSVMNTEITSVFPVNFQESNEVSSVAGVLDCVSYIGSALGSMTFGFLILLIGYESMLAIWAVLAIVTILPLVLNKRTKVNAINSNNTNTAIN